MLLRAPTTEPPLLFSNLRRLTLWTRDLRPISQLISLSQLPAARFLDFSIYKCPSRQELSSFLSSILMSGAGQTIEQLALEQSSSGDVPLRSNALKLGMEDLQPCLAFSNLMWFKLRIAWRVDLDDSGVLALASSWPLLGSLSINTWCGWNTQGGITPHGLLQLFRICPSLHTIDIAIDTRGYTELPSSGLLANLTLPPWRSRIFIDILDSRIEAESVPAIAAFFARTPHSMVIFEHFHGCKSTSWEIYRKRWNDVRELMERTES